VDSDEDLQDSGDDAELFRDFTAPTTGSSSSSSSASGRGPNYADGSAPIKSRIRGLQDLSRTKDSLSTKDSFGGGSGTSTTMIKVGDNEVLVIDTINFFPFLLYALRPSLLPSLLFTFFDASPLVLSSFPSSFSTSPLFSALLI
jgi:hypothetical protein